MSRPSTWLAPSAVAIALGGCTLTLPFDRLTEGHGADGGHAAGGDGGAPVLLAHYSFEEGAGTSARDRVGQHQGLLEDYAGKPPRWTPNGKVGGGIEFDLDDGWIYLPTLEGPRFPRRGTIAAWVRIATYGPEGNSVFDIEEDTEIEEYETPIEVYLERAGVTYRAQARGGPVEFLTAPAVPLNTWALVAAGWDLATREAVLFVRVDLRDPDPPRRGTLPDDFAIAYPSIILTASGGTLDEVRIWDGLLSEDELRRLD